MGLDQYPNGEEELVFDNLQSQDDAGDSTEGLKGPSEFVLDDGELGAGVIEVLKSMMKGEQCEAWLAPKYTGSGETPTKQERPNGLDLHCTRIV